MTAGVFAIDTSCIIAAVCGWHEHHVAAAAEIETRLERGEQIAVAGHALAEAYAVLTRFPSPHRLAPADAWALLYGNFASTGTVSTLTGRGYVALITSLAEAGIAGGRTYDAIVGDCARQAKATTLLTLNPRHFDPPPTGITIVTPAAR